MKPTTQPGVGLAMAVLLLVAGWYMSSNGVGTAQLFGWLFLSVGAVTAVVNLVLLLRQRS
ncbi:MAG: hypothetical protein QM619_13515 [Micropruina sp.]|uniref:hypothetical protein n=1 Tax=Micropruina sp. TaxID=2737536 RepID=UPI0039E517C5